MNAGKLKTKVNFYKFINVPDGFGGFKAPAQSVLILSTFCSLTQIKPSKDSKNIQEHIKTSYELKLRTRNGFYVNETNSIELRGAIYEITNVEEDFEKKELILIVVNSGTGL